MHGGDGGGGGGSHGGGGFSGGHHGGGFSGGHPGGSAGHHGGSTGHGHRDAGQNPADPGLIAGTGLYGEPGSPDQRRRGGASSAISLVAGVGVLLVFIVVLSILGHS